VQSIKHLDQSSRGAEQDPAELLARSCSPSVGGSVAPWNQFCWTALQLGRFAVVGLLGGVPLLDADLGDILQAYFAMELRRCSNSSQFYVISTSSITLRAHRDDVRHDAITEPRRRGGLVFLFSRLSVFEGSNAWMAILEGSVGGDDENPHHSSAALARSGSREVRAGHLGGQCVWRTMSESSNLPLPTST